MSGDVIIRDDLSKLVPVSSGKESSTGLGTKTDKPWDCGTDPSRAERRNGRNDGWTRPTYDDQPGATALAEPGSADGADGIPVNRATDGLDTLTSPTSNGGLMRQLNPLVEQRRAALRGGEGEPISSGEKSRAGSGTKTDKSWTAARPKPRKNEEGAVAEPPTNINIEVIYLQTAQFHRQLEATKALLPGPTKEMQVAIVVAGAVNTAAPLPLPSSIQPTGSQRAAEVQPTGCQRAANGQPTGIKRAANGQPTGSQLGLTARPRAPWNLVVVPALAPRAALTLEGTSARPSLSVYVLRFPHCGGAAGATTGGALEPANEGGGRREPTNTNAVAGDGVGGHQPATVYEVETDQPDVKETEALLMAVAETKVTRPDQVSREEDYMVALPGMEPPRLGWSVDELDAGAQWDELGVGRKMDDYWCTTTELEPLGSGDAAALGMTPPAMSKRLTESVAETQLTPKEVWERPKQAPLKTKTTASPTKLVVDGPAKGAEAGHTKPVKMVPNAEAMVEAQLVPRQPDSERTVISRPDADEQINLLEAHFNGREGDVTPPRTGNRRPSTTVADWGNGGGDRLVDGPIGAKGVETGQAKPLNMPVVETPVTEAMASAMWLEDLMVWVQSGGKNKEAGGTASVSLSGGGFQRLFKDRAAGNAKAVRCDSLPLGAWLWSRMALALGLQTLISKAWGPSADAFQGPSCALGGGVIQSAR
jgi:hypothetical protein